MVELKNMKYGEFERICDLIKKKLEWYEENFRGLENTYLTLSDGKRLKIAFPRKSIAHLLGIDTEYLKSTNLFSESSSYELLNRVVQEHFIVNKKVNEGLLTYRSFINEYIYEKLDMFDDNTKIDFNSIEFICKFEKSRCTYSEGQVNIEYFIGQKIDEYTIALLGIAGDGNVYFPVTSQIIDKTTDKGMEILEKYLSNQVLLLPITLRVDLNRNGYYTGGKLQKDNSLEMRDKLLSLKEYATIYNCTIDVSSALDFELKKDQGILNAIVKITNALERNDKIDLNLLGKVPKEIIGLVDRLNGLSLSPDGSAELVLSLQEEVRKITNNSNLLSMDNKTLKEERDRLREENSKLQEENDSLNETLEGVKKLVLKK